jgi:hypothetical protein
VVCSWPKLFEGFLPLSSNAILGDCFRPSLYCKLRNLLQIILMTTPVIVVIVSYAHVLESYFWYKLRQLLVPKNSYTSICMCIYITIGLHVDCQLPSSPSVPCSTSVTFTSNVVKVLAELENDGFMEMERFEWKPWIIHEASASFRSLLEVSFLLYRSSCQRTYSWNFWLWSVECILLGSKRMYCRFLIQ